MVPWWWCAHAGRDPTRGLVPTKETEEEGEEPEEEEEEGRRKEKRKEGKGADRRKISK